MALKDLPTDAQPREKLLAHQSQIDEAQGRLAQAQLQASEIQARRDKLRQEVEAARRSQAIYRERRISFERQIAEAAGELPSLETTTAAARLDLEAATTDLQTAQAELQTCLLYTSPSPRD